MKKLGIVLMALPFLSVFIWAAFDVQWWTSTTYPQQTILFFLHVIVVLWGFFLFLFSEDV